MHSLAQEIQGFSKNLLKKQSTRVTTVTGRKLLEKRCDGAEGEVEQVEELEEEGGCGFVEDTSLDLQVGVVRPFLLLGNTSQDAAHDIDTMQRFKVSHVLNVAYGVTNLFPDQVVYKTLQILDLPETDLSSHLEECSSYIDQAKKQHYICFPLVFVFFLEGLSFDDAYNQVKLARPSVRPNPGFYQQLQNYKP
uniref:Tyrosine-protein phosphatase domain-containing protein n=1 Tax=Xiphophorus couchianus TaxID=32473 RepID=A0A3B5M5L0_9TELE